MTAESSVPDAVREATDMTEHFKVCDCHDSWDQCPCADSGHPADGSCDCCPRGTGICGPRPDAARAKARADAIDAYWQHPQANSIGLRGNAIWAAIEAAAPHIVAAAVLAVQADNNRRIEAALALCQDENGYTTHDQIEKLGEPPWRGMDPNLVAWEQAHGHDVRLPCPEDCLLLIDPEDLRAALASPAEPGGAE